ncbi:restriction endonuclease subunit S [Pseudoalteromonas sp. Angola-4]|uniref:restriction endonuclease subunit S n=1 Tax=Pseudoalteromonas sp. Angola-4 TaxID=3025335 RepID=UPI0023585A71|nr:restriction endonuclease subunit S [Pseudoalteromonas sp. Angola-4]MDC9508997.1 restriction endonuclease subunit S [Pseudoalteromonas sp. Angola-4]
MAELASMQKYESYKDSGVDWLGDIPSEWNVTPGFNAYAENKRNNKGMKEDRVLSLSYGKIIVKPKEKLVGLVPESFETYQVVEPGDLIIRCMDLQNDKTSLRTGLSENHGIITSAYLNLKINERFDSKFLYYYLHSLDTTKVLYKFGTGLRQNLSFQDFYRLPVFDIPKNLQTAIASFLDKKTAQIDDAIAIKEKQIELLKERKQIIIQQAVTQGLNPDVPMEDSGVDWIGDIPEHWEVKKIKYLTKIFRGKFTHRPRNDPALYDGQYPFFQTGDVARANKFLYEFKQTLNEKGLKVSTLIPKGTVVITIAANIGDVAILDLDACFPDSVVGFSPYKEMDRDFLYYALGNMKQQFMDSSIKNTQMNLNVDRIGSNSLCQPPIEEQVKIVEVIENKSKAIDDAVELQKQQIEKLKEYKTTLINSAVTGKIKVPGVV